jgi:hypothetical protein
VFVNRLTVVYRAIESRAAEPTATVVLVVDGGVRLDRGGLLRDIEQLHFARDAHGHPHHVPFVSEDRYHHTSWGAEGATLEILVGAVSYAVAGIVGGAAWDGLKSIGRRIRSASGPVGPPSPIDELVAIQRAKLIAAASFKDVNWSGLTVLSVHLADGSATVVLRSEDGSTFTVRPEVFVDGAAIGPITRAYPDRDLPS